MAEEQLLKVWDNWEAGIGYPKDEGIPGLYTANKILGLRGELRPASVATTVAFDDAPDGSTPRDEGHHFQYFFEEPVTTGKTPQFDAGSDGSVSNDNTLTISHTVANNDNRLLVFGVVIDSTTSITDRVSITYSGSDLTLQAPGVMTVGSTTYLLAAAILAPAVGTANIVVTLTGAAATTMVGIGSSWYDIDQTGAGGNTNTATATSAGPATVNIVSTGAESVIDFAVATDNVQTMTVGASQTEASSTGGVAADDVRLGASYETGAATTTMSWSLGASCKWLTWGIALFGIEPGPSYLYAERGKKKGSSSTVKVNKISIANTDFANLETGQHNLTPLTIPGQPVRYQGYWWFPMGDNQKARRLQTIGSGAVSNDTLDATGTALGADHFANLGHQVISTLQHSGNDAGGVRILKVDGDIGTEADWGSAFQVGDKNERAAGVRTLAGLAFALNVEGLYSFNLSGRSGLIFEDFRTWRHVFDNISIVPWRRRLVISHPTGLLLYTPGQLPINIGVESRIAMSVILPSGPTELRGGRYHGVASIGDFLYAIYQPDISSKTANVMVGYADEASPTNLVWQQLNTTTLQDTDHMLGCHVTVSSKPLSAEYVTPTLWYGNDDNIDYIVLSTNASPFRTRADTHVVETAGDVYFPELFFGEEIELTKIVVYTQDMTSGDEWQMSGIGDGGSDSKYGAPIIQSGKQERKIEQHSVYRLLLHVNWVATSSSSRVPPTIKRIELYGRQK